MYGGTVDAWTGNLLEGWSAPQAVTPNTHPSPHRFETRIAATNDASSEQIYDWLEQSHPDGSALAIARNVTTFVNMGQSQQMLQPQSNTPSYEETQGSSDITETQQQHSNIESHHQVVENHDPENYETSRVSQETVAAQPLAGQPAKTQTHNQSPAHSEAIHQVSQNTTASTTQNYVEPSHNSFDTNQNSQALPPHVEQDAQSNAAHPDTIDNREPSYQQPAPRDQAQSHEEHNPAASTPAEEDYAPAATQNSEPHITPPSVERDFQRRALPMESNNSILGNNWRDAVIAKAVGGEGNEEDVPEQQKEQGDNGIKPMNILLAEDNAINALLTRTLLEAEGHTVETVEDGVLAVEAMKNQKYDLIFMDMRMPNMDGLEATRKIRQLPNVPRELPIIALTANAFDDDRNACFDSGMNDFMTKPVSAEELSAMVVRWTDKATADRNAA